MEASRGQRDAVGHRQPVPGTVISLRSQGSCLPTDRLSHRLDRETSDKEPVQPLVDRIDGPARNANEGIDDLGHVHRRDRSCARP